MEGKAEQHFTLAVGQQKAFVQFQRSSKTQDLEWLFSNEYGGKFILKTGSSEHHKEFYGSIVYPLLQRISVSGDDYIYLEINSPDICPAVNFSVQHRINQPEHATIIEQKKIWMT